MEIIDSIGTFIGMIIFFPAMVLIMHPVMGLLSLYFLNLFSWLYVAVIGILFIVQLIIPKGVRNIAISVLSLGIIMMWLSLFVSYQGLLYNHIDFSNPAPAALGGFPITAFEYPPGALGGDVPPFDTWGLFYLNLIFWIVVGVVVAALFRQKIIKQLPFKLFSASVLISLYGLGYLFVKFD